MTLLDVDPPLRALEALLNGELPDGWTADADNQGVAPGTVALTVVSSPTGQSFTLAGGPEKARMLVQATTVAATAGLARVAGDKVRRIAAGRDRRNRPTYPLDAVGYGFDPTVSLGDGHADTGSGVHSWVETFALTWQLVPVIES